jgi:hypothetical protein
LLKTDNFLEFLLEKAREKENRPEMLPNPLPTYNHDFSKYPERIRVSFGDGSTAIYDLRVEMPAPQIVESVKIIRKWKQGYVNQPARRRRRK